MYKYPLVAAVGKTRGHLSSKENRAAKLLKQWKALTTKMGAMIRRGRGITETSKLAYATLVMMETGIRVGNEGSAEGFVCENKFSSEFGKIVKTFGLTTLLGEHASCDGNQVHLRFVGKKVVMQELVTSHPLLVQYFPASEPDALFLGVDYGPLKRFIRRYIGKGFTPKDLRTAKVNLLFIDLFQNGHADDFIRASKKGERNRILSSAIEETAQIIGHTKGVCRSAYLSNNLLEYIREQYREDRMREQGLLD